MTIGGQGDERLGPDDRGAVAVRWRETPGSSRAIQRRGRSVPVQMRSVVLDLSRSPPVA